MHKTLCSAKKIMTIFNNLLTILLLAVGFLLLSKKKHDGHGLDYSPQLQPFHPTSHRPCHCTRRISFQNKGLALKDKPSSERSSKQISVIGRNVAWRKKKKEKGRNSSKFKTRGLFNFTWGLILFLLTSNRISHSLSRKHTGRKAALTEKKENLL